jgi:hypothetical protein
MTALLAVLLAASSPVLLDAQQKKTPPPPVAGVVLDDRSIASDHVEFGFKRPGLSVPSYDFLLWENGAGQYRGEELPMSDGHTDPPPSAQPFVLMKFTVMPATVTKIYALARSLNHFNVACASNAKNVADTGTKTLEYIHPGMDRSVGSCTYNYTENKDIQTLTDIFEGIAATLDEGRKLDYLHRYDRLGLDAEMESFTREVSDGHAIELQVIVDTLRSLADDPEVMQRVRTRANALLTLVPAQTR